ncbi:MAG: HlyD family efflux transporter periplasmic adaptor subunit [Gammaproteobacteria bacterium]|nr:HlyD family efflux transporter periplasmic adaptor subunit [Gammaproteobacteria bacterium]
MRATRKRLLIWAVIATSLVVILALLFRPQPVLVDLATVTEGSLLITIDEEGETRVRDTFVLSAPVSGRISRINAKVGDEVIAGETIFGEIDPIDPVLLDVRSRAQAEASMHAAEAAEALATANLAQAQAEAEFAESELERAHQLRRDKMVSIREVDHANRNYKIALASLDTASAALSVSRFDLERAQVQLLSHLDTQQIESKQPSVPVRAPVNGRVLRVLRESEGIIAAGNPLVEIGDTADLEIVVDLLSTDAVKVKPGQRVIINGWGGDAELTGKVRRVEPFAETRVSALGIEEQRVNVIVDLLSAYEERPGLGHGYQLAVRIVLFEGDDIVTVPLTSLIRDDDRWALFVEQNDRAVRRRVSIGRLTGLVAEVIDGLEIGERIVLYPSDRVVDQARIIDRQSS